ncbi:MAG TPA: c-type cytochrome biogenesis protein CcmI [Stellaceae bacterium]|nr:c-type cytochrome biogenesis protein CcmI [Stellaceae bacterium]
MQSLIVFALLAVLAILVLGFVFVPLARGRAARGRDRNIFARAVYRDQLAELTRDRERGVLDAGEEAAARREIERRLLAAGDTASDTTAKPRPVLAALLGLFVLAVAAGLYFALGSPGLPDRPYAGREAERAAASHRMPTDLNKAVADLEAKLKAKPDNLDGWILLGRTEAARQNWHKSAEAMAHAVALAPTRDDLLTAYGEIQVMADGGLVTPQARDAFTKALTLDAKNARALWYLGLEAVQQRKVGMAQDYWRKLLAVLPADGEEHKTVSEALAAIDKAEKAATEPRK